MPNAYEKQLTEHIENMWGSEIRTRIGHGLMLRISAGMKF